MLPAGREGGSGGEGWDRQKWNGKYVGISGKRIRYFTHARDKTVDDKDDSSFTKIGIVLIAYANGSFTLVIFVSKTFSDSDT